ncbi:Y-family DNA polymerase [Empedobacter falsenii]|uniref:Y-family DNA polymerase n=1 Tax=Empedobacter falsenii TaxID=343874 RepID=UPI0025757DC7|nr:Y-family DNA polymerase [Empedobacter falsenii]MDM1299780.1 Y-family DNA polymerase [Empedobacter falsenii]MDM1319573.1 Y-family DNA polymerase [Empedobacter falsenii]
MFMLVDCNNFYASCHRVFEPSLTEVPIVVLSNNDGCVVARSNQAKDLGIPMGAAAFKYNDLFIKNKVQVFSSNYQLYADLSNRVATILSEFSPDIEIYSIDESFLKLRGFDRFNLVEYGIKIKDRIWQYTHIPVCVGIAPTKALAKVANRIAKKFPSHHHGVFKIETDEQIVKALKWLDIEDVWGIGRQISKRLRLIGVNKAFDFVKLSDEFIRSNFSIVELRLKKELLGISVLDLGEIQTKKSIATTRSFEITTASFDYLKERVSTFAVSSAEKLRKQHSNCNLVTVFVQTNFFKKDFPQYSRSITLKIPFETQSSITISKYATLALNQIFKEGYQYKRAGVIVSGILPESQKQFSLFDFENPKHIALMRSMDSINSKFGSATSKLASQDLKRTWKMKQERLSPCYTTKWNDLLKVD